MTNRPPQATATELTPAMLDRLRDSQAIPQPNGRVEVDCDALCNVLIAGHAALAARPNQEATRTVGDGESGRAALYAKALFQMRDMLIAVHDGLENEGDRVYLGSSNHAELIHEAWHFADALKWDEILEDRATLTAKPDPEAVTRRELVEARNAALEEAAGVIDQCNSEGPYNAIGAASRIRALLTKATRPEGETA